MNNSEYIAINLTSQEYISGSQEYSVSLNITNISGKPIADLQVFNTLSAGRELPLNDDLDASNLTELEDKKRRLIRELERGVEKRLCAKTQEKTVFL